MLGQINLGPTPDITVDTSGLAPTPTLTADQLNQYLAQLPVTTPTEAAQVDPYLLQAAAIGASGGTSPIGPGTLPVSWLFIGVIALGLAFLFAAKK